MKLISRFSGGEEEEEVLLKVGSKHIVFECSGYTMLSRLLEGKTVLVIAHRMRTVAAADHIVVLENGRVAEEGSPAQLMEKGGLYSRMVKLQNESARWTLE